MHLAQLGLGFEVAGVILVLGQKSQCGSFG